MPDFTINTYRLLLETLLSKDYSFIPFVQYLKEAPPGCIILRHDVDDSKLNSLQTASLENKLGIRGTYYFRMVPESFDEGVIRQIYDLGHEVGYHYEDLSAVGERGVFHSPKRSEGEGRGVRRAQDARHKTQGRNHVQEAPLPASSAEALWRRRRGARGGLKEVHKENENFLLEQELCRLAIGSFQKNLETLRRIVPIETICMHGSPLSRWDNRLFWQYYDYHDLGIIGEPYFDLDFNEVLYLTDTGRRWDGEAVSVRDKAMSSEKESGRVGEGEKGREEERNIGGMDSACPTPHAPRLTPHFHSTTDIIRAARSNSLPDKIMITVHPQRWTNRPLPWIRELVWQNIKNAGKWVVVRSRR